jgi:CBS domain containing-hemolysin-like protein
MPTKLKSLTAEDVCMPITSFAGFPETAIVSMFQDEIINAKNYVVIYGKTLGDIKGVIPITSLWRLCRDEEDTTFKAYSKPSQNMIIFTNTTYDHLLQLLNLNPQLTALIVVNNSKSDTVVGIITRECVYESLIDYYIEEEVKNENI